MLTIYCHIWKEGKGSLCKQAPIHFNLFVQIKETDFCNWGKKNPPLGNYLELWLVVASLFKEQDFLNFYPRYKDCTKISVLFPQAFTERELSQNSEGIIFESKVSHVRDLN